MPRVTLLENYLIIENGHVKTYGDDECADLKPILLTGLNMEELFESKLMKVEFSNDDISEQVVLNERIGRKEIIDRKDSAGGILPCSKALLMGYFGTKNSGGAILQFSAEADDEGKLISSSSKKSYLKLQRHLANYTKVVGENIRLKCEVEGFPPPRFKWFQNEAPVREERAKITIRRFSPGGHKYISRLRISKLDILDTAYYKCQASNDGHQVKTTAILKVKLSKYEVQLFI
ncbi:Inactive tyrosine-protein kinase transmembrane receptor ROR1 [Nymphon striatum]|nr:Inactive tyrosine-protein kinase transmembrane receptor ROR1 [Nymphon striatum]